MAGSNQTPLRQPEGDGRSGRLMICGACVSGLRRPGAPVWAASTAGQGQSGGTLEHCHTGAPPPFLMFGHLDRRKSPCGAPEL